MTSAPEKPSLSSRALSAERVRFVGVTETYRSGSIMNCSVAAELWNEGLETNGPHVRGVGRNQACIQPPRVR